MGSAVEETTRLHNSLGPVAASMGWADGAQVYLDALDQSLLITGRTEAQVATLTGDDLLHFRMMFSAEIWRVITDYLALDIDYSADGASFKRQQGVDNARKRRTEYLMEAAKYGLVPDYTADTATVTHADPYVVDYS